LQGEDLSFQRFASAKSASPFGHPPVLPTLAADMIATTRDLPSSGSARSRCSYVRDTTGLPRKPAWYTANVAALCLRAGVSAPAVPNRDRAGTVGPGHPRCTDPNTFQPGAACGDAA
jgi:hypothetical protein